MTEQHPYHSMGARRDRAKTWAYLERIASALEQIATALSTPAVVITASAGKGEEVCECGHPLDEHDLDNEGDRACGVCTCMFYLAT